MPCFTQRHEVAALSLRNGDDYGTTAGKMNADEPRTDTVVTPERRPRVCEVSLT